MAKRKSEFKRKKRFTDLNRDLTEEERAELKRQIEKHGCQSPIVITRGDVIIDGHNRDEICCELGIDTPFIIKNWSEDACYEWALREQLGRRNLSRDDYVLTLGRLYNAKKKPPGRPKKTPNSENTPKTSGNSDTTKVVKNDHLKTADAMADEHNVSAKTIRRAGSKAAAIDEKLIPPAKKMYAAGTLTLAQAESLAKKSPDEQHDLARKIRTGQIKWVPNGKPKKVAEPKQRKYWEECADDHNRARQLIIQARKLMKALEKRESELAEAEGRANYLVGVHGRIMRDTSVVMGAIGQSTPVGVKRGGQIKTKADVERSKK